MDDRLGWTIPAVDISTTIGIGHDTVKHILIRCKMKFGAFSTVSDIMSPTSATGKIKVTCLNRDGVILLINRLAPEQIKDLPQLDIKTSQFRPS